MGLSPAATRASAALLQSARLRQTRRDLDAESARNWLATTRLHHEQEGEQVRGWGEWNTPINAARCPPTNTTWSAATAPYLPEPEPEPEPEQRNQQAAGFSTTGAAGVGGTAYPRFHRPLPALPASNAPGFPGWHVPLSVPPPVRPRPSQLVSGVYGATVNPLSAEMGGNRDDVFSFTENSSWGGQQHAQQMVGHQQARKLPQSQLLPSLPAQQQGQQKQQTQQKQQWRQHQQEGLELGQQWELEPESEDWEAQMQDLTYAFLAADMDGGGAIGTDEFGLMMTVMGCELDIDSVVRVIRVAKNAFSQWLKREDEENVQKCQQVWDKYDDDNSGTMSLREINNVIKALQVLGCKAMPMTSEKMRSMARYVHSDTRTGSFGIHLFRNLLVAARVRRQPGGWRAHLR